MNGPVYWVFVAEYTTLFLDTLYFHITCRNCHWLMPTKAHWWVYTQTLSSSCHGQGAYFLLSILQHPTASTTILLSADLAPYPCGMGSSFCFFSHPVSEQTHTSQYYIFVWDLNVLTPWQQWLPKYSPHFPPSYLPMYVRFKEGAHLNKAIIRIWGTI